MGFPSIRGTILGAPINRILTYSNILVSIQRSSYFEKLPRLFGFRSCGTDPPTRHPPGSQSHSYVDSNAWGHPQI